MSRDIQLILVILAILLPLGLLFRSIAANRRREPAEAVQPAVPYRNNHHVLGVGYYHATHQCWHPYPWNEFREAQGFYWDGAWHTEPDERQVPSSVPHLAEIQRVNRLWRMDGREASGFWEDVDRFGFGTAIGRRTSS